MPRALWRPLGGGLFLMGEVPLYLGLFLVGEVPVYLALCEALVRIALLGAEVASQGHNLALTVLHVPYSLDSVSRETTLQAAR